MTPWRLAWPSVRLTPVTPALFGRALQGQLILEVSSGLCAQRGEGRSNASSRGLVTLQEWRCNLSSPMFNHEEKLFIVARAAHLIRACFAVAAFCFQQIKREMRGLKNARLPGIP